VGEKLRSIPLSSSFVRLLGPIQIVDEGGTVVDAPSVTQRRLLAILAVHHGTSVRAENLAQLLTVSMGALRQTVARIRSLAGSQVIQTDPIGYRLGIGVDADVFIRAVNANGAEMGGVARLQALESALALWHGNALEEFGFEPWAQGEATRLNELCNNAMSDRIELLVDLSRSSEAIADAHALVASNPLSDRPHGLLIRALAGAGRQSEALRAYQTYRSFLIEETGTEPSIEVQRIEQLVATGWRGTDAAGEPENPLFLARERHRPAHRSNVPSPITSWVGEREQLVHVAKELPTHRIVTLTGSGGVGKTRSAVEIARICLETDTFADGVLFFELAAITDPAGIVSAVASSLSIQSQNNMTMTEAIVDWLQGRSMLLVFDNCEHVRESVSSLILALVQGNASLSVLATSRERLGIQGERITQIQLLSTHESVALFCERALATDDTLVFGDADIATIDSICQQLDCIPLAIELAAARMSTFAPGDVLERLDQRFALLTGNRNDGSAHQRTLRSAVDWSYQLLDATEQLLFDQLSVFAGSFNLAAVESVCTHLDELPIDTAKTLASLAEKSMVVVERKPFGVRYRLLETLRQFGAEQLAERYSFDDLRLRHLQYFVLVCEKEYLRWFSAAQFEADAVLDREWDNLRAAMAYSCAAGATAYGERLAIAIVPYAVHRMRSEHGDWCNSLVEAAQTRAKALSKSKGAAKQTPVLQAEGELHLSAVFFGWTAWWSMIRSTHERTLALCVLGQQHLSSEMDPGRALCKSMEASTLFLLGRRSEGRKVGHEFSPALLHASPWEEYTLRRALFVVSVGQEFATHAQRLAAIAERFGAPSLIASARFYQGFSKALSAEPDFVTAAVLHQEGVQLAQLAKAPFAESQNLQGLLEARLAMNTDDVLLVCSEALHRIHDLRHWVYLWRVVDITALLLAQRGRVSEASLAVGHLDAHVPGWQPEPRSSTKALLALEPPDPESTQRGGAMDRDSLVRQLIEIVDEMVRASGAANT
jgi:predicted ATPase/DNA-binding SARP family transcriptional activator